MSDAHPPIDAFRPLVDGRYVDQVVTVERAGDGFGGAPQTVRTAHFDLAPLPGQRLLLRHLVAPAAIDDDLTGLLQEELFAPGWLTGSDLFERLFTGIVVSSAPSPLAAWVSFYRNTLRRLDEARPVAEDGSPADHSSLLAFAPVHERALREVVEASVGALPDVLDVASCFGFFPIQLAARGIRVTASDVNDGSVRLLSAVAPYLLDSDGTLRTLTCDAARVPLADRSVRTVTLLHLLEHVDPRHGVAILAEACRLAETRVVVAVPLEEEATLAYGHVRTLTLDDLATLGAGSGWTWRVDEDHGGWLVLDRP